MATPGLQIAYLAPREADLKLSIASTGAVSSANSRITSNAYELQQRENYSFGKSTDKMINPRNAVIALTIVLLLLLALQVKLFLTLQAPVCCDGVLTTKLTLPPEVEQPLRPAPAILPATPPAVAKKPVAKSAVEPVTAEAEPAITKPEKKATIARPALSLGALAADPKPAAPVINEELKSAEMATLATIAESNFVKISNSGEALDHDDTKWECVEDKSNNLTWEVKKNDGGLRDKGHSYSWLRNINGENRGVSNGGRCKGGVNCDTSSYARAINTQNLCGYSDWRLPTREELETLVEYNKTSKGATINKTFFPEAVPSWYWTASENPRLESYAWYVLFQNGVALNDLKERPKHIRLVRDNRAQQEYHANTTDH